MVAIYAIIAAICLIVFGYIVAVLLVLDALQDRDIL